jgi:hypothetical protein
MEDFVKNKVIKLLDAGIIYPISDSKWVSPTQVFPKKSGITIVKNANDELIATRLVTGWRMCIDYRKLNSATRKDHFPLPFIDQILERVSTPRKNINFIYSLIPTPIWRFSCCFRDMYDVLCVCAGEHKFGVATNHGKFKV